MSGSVRHMIVAPYCLADGAGVTPSVVIYDPRRGDLELVDRTAEARAFARRLLEACDMADAIAASYMKRPEAK